MMGSFPLKAGDLVMIIHARIGVPAGTIGIILEIHEGRYENECKYLYYNVQLCNARQRTICRLAQDLKVINASR